MKTFRPALAVALALAASAFSCSPDEPHDVSKAERRVVYGQDGRVEAHQAPMGVERLARESVVALIPSRTVDAELLWDAPAWAEVDDLCEGAAFSEQPSVVSCTGVLVASDLVLTAGHCARNLDCENLSVVFDFAYDREGLVLPFSQDSVFECAKWIESAIPHVGSQADYGWLRLKRDATPPRSPARLAPANVSRAPHTAVSALGFGGGIPMKWHTSATIIDDSGEWFSTDLDLFSGNSGSPVLSAEGEVLGIVSTGLDDYLYSPKDECNLVRTEYSADDFEHAERATTIEKALDGLCRPTPLHELCATLSFGDAEGDAEPAFHSEGGCRFAPSAYHGSSKPLVLGFSMACFAFWCRRMARRRARARRFPRERRPV